MRTDLLSSSKSPYYGFGGGDVEHYEYACPCGKGSIVEEHDNIPGFRDHSVRILCDECSQKYEIDESNGCRNWELVEKE